MKTLGNAKEVSQGLGMLSIKETKLEIKKRARKILDNLDNNEAVRYESDQYFLIKFFSNHPKWNEKTQGQFDYFFKLKNEWGYSFHIMRLDKTFEAIGMNYSLTINKKHDVNKALRNAIEHQIKTVRDKINYGVDRCELSGCLLTKDNSHIDHYNLDFKDVVSMWMQKNNYTYDFLYDNIEKLGVKFYITNDDINNSFNVFHEENTNLRAILASENLKRSKI
jgi:hypothetical protein